MSTIRLKKYIDKLPDTPGVYFFRDAKKRILYIGKATSLRDRVRSYFGKDLIFTRGPVVFKMIEEASSITFTKTDSVLEALILETSLIKKYQPRANAQQKDDKSYNYVIITKEKFPRVVLSRAKNVPKDFPPQIRLYSIGPFPQGGTLKEGMKIIRKIFPFRDRCLPMQSGTLEKGKPCFNRQIGLCPGVCTGEISASEYKKIIRNLILFFEGKKEKIIKNLEKEMKAFAKAREFEKADRIKKTVFALKHIQDISLLKENIEKHGESTFRIESYDIAHLGGKEMVGVMVVIEDGLTKKSDYRKFSARGGSAFGGKTVLGNNKPNDIAAIKEIITRRLSHSEWPSAQLIVVDGGVAQKNAVESVLAEKNLKIEVVAVRKDDRHKPEELIGKKETVEKHEKAILLSNSEAHRFAITYHKKLRQKKFIPEF